MDRFIWGIVLGLVLAVSGALIARHIEGNAAQQKVDIANAAALHFQIAYSLTANAWEERAFAVTDQKVLLAQVEEGNAQLVRHLRDANARILSLANTVASLEARFDSSATDIAQVDSLTYRVDLDESLVLASGGFIRVHGPITLTIEAPPTVITDLAVQGRFPISVVISKLPNGELAVHAYTGDPRLTIASVDVIRAVDDRSSSLFDGIAKALVAPGPWIGLGIGFGVCQLLTR